MPCQSQYVSPSQPLIMRTGCMACKSQHVARDWTMRQYVLAASWVNLCEPHSCPCGTPVDTRGVHGLSCKRNAGRSTRHPPSVERPHLASSRRCASIPSIKEPNGLFRSDGKRPDGLTLIPWQAVKCLCLGCYCGQHTRRILQPCFWHGCWQYGRRHLQAQGS